MKVNDTTPRFAEALNVMNKALEAHRDEIPYKQLIQAADKLADGTRFGVAVYKDDPDTPHDYYTTTWDNGQLALVEHGKQDPDITWKVSDEYIDKVADNPREYIEHPAKLDWDWLKTRLNAT
jgi:hypothetical protein